MHKSQQHEPQRARRAYEPPRLIGSERFERTSLACAKSTAMGCTTTDCEVDPVTGEVICTTVPTNKS
jgi:hypothetical protein